MKFKLKPNESRGILRENRKKQKTSNQDRDNNTMTAMVETVPPWQSIIVESHLDGLMSTVAASGFPVSVAFVSLVGSTVFIKRSTTLNLNTDCRNRRRACVSTVKRRPIRTYKFYKSTNIYIPRWVGNDRFA